MFAYIDDNILKLLCEQKKLIHLDAQGNPLLCENDQGAPYLSMVGPVPLPMMVAGKEEIFSWYAFTRRSELRQIYEVADRVKEKGLKDLWPLIGSYMAVNSLLLYGPFSSASHPLVRIHSSCLTSDVLGSRRCECGPQLHRAREMIVEEGCGAILYMASHEGRGIGLWAKAVTYLLQDMGQDTYQANESLGLPADSRDFSEAGVVLRALRPDGDGIRLLSNNTLKKQHLEKVGVSVVRMEPLVCGITDHNRLYLLSKREHGHLIPAVALGLKEENTEKEKSS